MNSFLTDNERANSTRYISDSMAATNDAAKDRQLDV